MGSIHNRQTMDMTILHSNVRGMTPKKWEHVRAAVLHHHLPIVLGEEVFNFTIAKDISEC